MSRITHVSNCYGLGLLFLNDKMELEIEEIKNKSYEKIIHFIQGNAGKVSDL